MLRNLLKTLLILVLFLAVLEGILRLVGFKPYDLPTFTFEVRPSPCFGNNDLRVNLILGKYDVAINKELKFTATHNNDSCRITSFINKDSLPYIAVLGCSYSYGTGVSDEETYPFMLNSKLANYDIVNYSVLSYGTVQHYLQLQEIFLQEDLSEIVIINYADFHEERNLLSRRYQYKLYQGYKLVNNQKNTLYYPKLILLKDSFHVIQTDVLQQFKPFPFRNYLATANAIELMLANWSSKKTDDSEGSKLLLKQMNELCLAHNTTLIVADIDYASDSEEIEKFCKNQNIAYVNISPNFEENGFRNLPYDNHPNFAAHKCYADKMFNYLEENMLIQ